MAQQPPEGPWKPASPNGQDQVRTAWQPPPPFENSPRDSYPPPKHQAQHQSREQAGAARGADQDEQHTLEWEQPVPPGPQPQWQAPPPAGPGYQAPGSAGYQAAPGSAGYQVPGGAPYQAPASRAGTAGHTKGFVASLFDFGFTSFVTPKVVKGLYALAALWTIIVAIWLLLVGIKFGGSGAATIIFLLIGLAIFGLLSLGSIRVFLEFFMALHRINENIQVLRDREEEK